MGGTEIFIPIRYMISLSVIVMIFVTILRLKVIYLDKKVSGENYRHPDFPEGSNILKNGQRNLANLFEFPILFYALCIMIYVTGNVDETFVKLAWYFLYFRIAHSIYHIFFNHIILGGFPARAMLFVPSLIIIIMMTWRFYGMI
jgi:hypothetical protein|tara:strand:- start:110 stop:541 length:432 start_codon:yes stop_codon:yes gene_type:complete